MSAGPAAALTIRPMLPDDDLDAELDLRHRAFGPMDSAADDFWRTEVLASIVDGRQLGVWDDGRLVGAGRFYDLRQWWRGRVVPMAGVAGIKVAPEARGRGVGRALMTAMLGVIAERGYPVSALYPATAHLYRSLGWELAGGHYIAEVPGRSLGSLLAPDTELPAGPEVTTGSGVTADGASGAAALAQPLVRRAVPGDEDEVIAVLGAVHASAGDCGPCTFDPATIRRWLSDRSLFGYLAEDGFLGYGWDGSDHEIMVHTLAAASAATTRALWGIVASHASVTELVRAIVGPADPVGWLTREPDVTLRRHKTWMLRVVDPVAAIAGRGFPAGLSGQVPLLLADPDLPRVAGPYTLSVRDGRGHLTPGITERSAGSPAAAPVTLGPRGLAALYAGTPMATLRRAGLAAGGGAAADDLLDSAFAGQPYLLDYF